MKITRKHLTRVLIPGFGVTALAITAISVSSADSHLNSIRITSHHVTAPADTSNSNITVNGIPVPLDSSGHASVSTGNGATVNVSSPPASSPQPSQDNTTKSTTNVSFSITSDGKNQNSSSDQNDGTPDVHVFGGSSTFSSSFSQTSVFSNGDGVVQINQSN